MSKKLLLGLDIGTTTCKISVFDIEDKKYFNILREYNLNTPYPGWIEIDAENMWKSILEGIRECVYKSKYNPKDIKAISYSVLGAAITAISKDGKVLYPFIEAWDSRDKGYKKYIDMFFEIFGENKLFSITGSYLVYSSINKVLWLRNNRKDIFNKTWKFMCTGDFITYRLTGIPVIDPSMASLMMNFDIRKNKYSDEILDKIDLEKDLFSNTFDAGEVVGNIKKEIADYTGLSGTTKVVVGSFDQTCSALGVGNIKEGIVTDGLGTVECIGITTSEPNTTKYMRENKIPCHPHAVKGKYFSWGAHLASGMMLKWYRDTLCQEEVRIAKNNDLDVYDIIIKNASKSPKGSRNIFILPHLRGSGMGIKPSLNSFSKCSIIGLNISHNKSDISRAILEGIAFESKAVLESLEKTGVEIEEMRATGGGTKSEFWLQIRANIMNKKIVVPKFKDAGLMGAIILASLGLNIFKSEKEAVENLVNMEKTIYPEDKEIVEFYNKRFEVYKRIYPILLPLYEDIKKL